MIMINQSVHASQELTEIKPVRLDTPTSNIVKIYLDDDILFDRFCNVNVRSSQEHFSVIKKI